MSILVMSGEVIMRPRTRSTKPSRLSASVTELRKELRQTQQQFAQTLETSITAIARYETTRSPSGDILLRLDKLAREHDRVDLSDVFYSAMVGKNPSVRLELSIKLQSAALRLVETLREIRSNSP